MTHFMTQKFSTAVVVRTGTSSAVDVRTGTTSSTVVVVRTGTTLVDSWHALSRTRLHGRVDGMRGEDAGWRGSLIERGRHKTDVWPELRHEPTNLARLKRYLKYGISGRRWKNRGADNRRCGWKSTLGGLLCPLALCFCPVDRGKNPIGE